MKLLEHTIIWIVAFLFICIFSFLLAFPFKWCWNYVMPYLFELKTITWGQSWCLTFVFSALFKSYHLHTDKKK